MTVTNRPVDLPSSELVEKLLAQPSAEPLSGEILVRSRADFFSEDRKVVAGVWESDPGESRWEFLERGELIHVVAGRMTVVEDGGEPAEVTAGTSAYFPIGWVGTWTVHEKLRKFFVVYKP
jgi:uncharacterized cupin superfamily protein